MNHAIKQCPSLAAHADWSIDPRKRWITVARRTTTGWTLTAPRLVGDVTTLLTRLIAEAGGGPVALGAQLPDFFTVCATLDEIRPDRPFYPARGIAGMTRLSHALALGMIDATGLSRACDRATAERPAGAPLFWTLGANQSGKAAITAWQHLILPALAMSEPPLHATQPARATFEPPPHLDRQVPSMSQPPLHLWPFEGPFRALLSPGSVALAETYPAEALRHLGIKLRGSKRRHADRSATAGALLAAMDQQSATPDDTMRRATQDGFGADPSGEDCFDSVLGVLCVLNVLAGHRPDTAPDDPWIQRWEGWVLGQTALPRNGPGAVGRGLRTIEGDPGAVGLK